MKLANQQTSTSAKARPSDPNVLGFEESSEDDESDDESSEGAESVSDSEEAEGSSENHQSKVEGSIGDNINSKDKSKDLEQNEPEDPDDKKGTPCDQETMSSNKKKVTSDEASVVKVKINTYKSIFLFSRPKQPLLSFKYIRFFYEECVQLQARNLRLVCSCQQASRYHCFKVIIPAEIMIPCACHLRVLERCIENIIFIKCQIL